MLMQLSTVVLFAIAVSATRTGANRRDEILENDVVQPHSTLRKNEKYEYSPARRDYSHSKSLFNWLFVFLMHSW
jgi:hypothetical protein